MHSPRLVRSAGRPVSTLRQIEHSRLSCGWNLREKAVPHVGINRPEPVLFEELQPRPVRQEWSEHAFELATVQKLDSEAKALSLLCLDPRFSGVFDVQRNLNALEMMRSIRLGLIENRGSRQST